MRWLLLWQSTDSAAVAHRPSCSVAGGILPHQGWNLCPQQWQVDSQPLDPQGSPLSVLLWREVGDLIRPMFCIHSFEALRDAMTWNPRISRKAGTPMTLPPGPGVVAPYAVQRFTDHRSPLHLKLQRIWSPPQDRLAQNQVPFFSVFWHCCAACGILVPNQRSNPCPLH